MDNNESMTQPTMAEFAARLAYHRGKARAKSARVRDGILEIDLATGATVSIAARRLRHLAHLSDQQIENVRLTGGDTLMWRDPNAARSTDVDLSVDSLLQALTGLQTHREIASKGGSARTPAKAAAARANGKKGGRPRKMVPTETPTN